MDVALFDFALPDALIAVRPAEPRDAARLLVVHAGGRLEHAQIRDLPRFLRRGDSLVVNDTKVIQARLRAHRPPRDPALGPGVNVEIMLHKRLDAARHLAFARPARRLAPGDVLQIGGDLSATVLARGEGGEVEIVFSQAGAVLDAAIARVGETPLPPYIVAKRPADARDLSDYQTMFARAEGSVAAPTAGLHFTPSLMAALAEAGVADERVTLHVGAGTFLPITTHDTEEHRMHAEYAVVGAPVAARLNAARAAGGRTVAVGTTTLRTLESAAGEGGTVQPFADDTSIFITPGYRFRAVDALFTNFHLPRSTLFMLVCAFSGIEVMQHAYAEAIREGYRFYSYGDACLLLSDKDEMAGTR